MIFTETEERLAIHQNFVSTFVSPGVANRKVSYKSGKYQQQALAFCHQCVMLKEIVLSE